VAHSDQQELATLVMILENQGFTVHRCGDNLELAGHLAAGSLDLAILDWETLKADGFRMLHSRAGAETWRWIPILLLSPVRNDWPGVELVAVPELGPQDDPGELLLERLTKGPTDSDLDPADNSQ